MLMTLESWGQVMKLKCVILYEKDIFIKVGSYHIPQQREKEDKKYIIVQFWNLYQRNIFYRSTRKRQDYPVS